MVYSLMKIENQVIFTLYNVCSVHRGMFSTLGVFSTSGDIMMNVGGYHEYIGGCSIHQRDTMSPSGDVQYIGRIS